MNAEEFDGDAAATVRVLIADDQELLRASFRLLIELTPGLEVVGEAGNGAEAVELARREQPDVVLMDIRMPEVDGIQATRMISGDPRTPRTRVLILTTFDFDVYVFTALRAGASGFLLKDVAPNDLIAAIRAVAAGDALPASAVTRSLIARYAAGSPVAEPDQPVAGLDHVTDREREVLLLIAGGMSNAEIADRLRLGAATVKTHITRLLAKLHARDRAQLVIAAYESGLVVASRHRDGRPAAGVLDE
ncbi:response regulator [Actinoplanes sp. NPDC000266]